VLATTRERALEVFRTTRVQGDVTERTFGMKEVEMMGCTLMGVTLVGMMASFPHVQQRVHHWEREKENALIVVDTLRSVEGTRIISEYPRKHTLTRVDTTNSFDRVAQKHKKRGFFFTSALRERGIVGVIPGATKVWKYNTYGLTRPQVKYLADTLREIARENGIPVQE
jgi:Sep-tRNA:Cys-tRNA synthetase